MPVVAKVGRATLRDYGGAGMPVVVVPSLINPPFILDLMEGNSLLRWLATQGVRPLLVDWGDPTPAERVMDISAHVEKLLLPLMDAIGERPLLAGYCLGGTMAMAAAALRPVSGLAMIAAPWNFSGFGDDACAEMTSLWTSAVPMVDALGLVPMEVLQTGFWQLDPDRVIDKYAAFAAMPPESDGFRTFVAMEDWANSGAPLTQAAGQQLFERFVGADDPGMKQWRVGDRVIDPAALSCPAFDILSASDRIVPAASASGLPNRLVLEAGHVGMVVGRQRMTLWQPLASWLSQVQHN